MAVADPPALPMGMVPLGEHEVTEPGKDGRRRLKIVGRRGFPIMILEGETPEQAWTRYQLKVAEREAAEPKPPKPPKPGPADRIRQTIGQSGGDQAPAVDPPPRPATRKAKGSLTRPTDAQLTEMLEELLALPAIPFGLPVQDPDPAKAIDLGGGRSMPGVRPRCAFCRDHFVSMAHPTACEIVNLSKQSDPIRRVLDRCYAAWGAMTIGSVLAMYLMKPMLHHLAPEPVLDGIGPVFQIPPRPPTAPKRRRPRNRRGKEGENAEADQSAQHAAQPAAAPAVGSDPHGR